MHLIATPSCVNMYTWYSVSMIDQCNFIHSIEKQFLSRRMSQNSIKLTISLHVDTDNADRLTSMSCITWITCK